MFFLSSALQGYVYHACEICKKAIVMVNKLELFSRNEDIEEVASGEIKYVIVVIVTSKCVTSCMPHTYL